MAKQLNVNLSFNADTSQAKAQIQALSKSLQDIAKMPGNASNLFDDTQIKKASQAALELQQHLSKAVNVDTGKLDLSRFSSSLKTSNKDLSIYCNTLLSTGEKGQQAFLQLAQAIATADTPVTRVNKKLAEMGTTLKNTARWQISSSILHGFMGAVQSAYGYAQDLNKSLNEIRIVTGQNIEQMSKFAAEANRAARALSTTTTEYTDASLIYYQQGLSDSEVAKRTEVTIKMANAAGQSAQIVSDQLTAIWNNFYDGSKSLEYYADVMTALGAATASSTDEIAGGLEKFAAIGETIGLSYEYAASALATITSNTRQSEEVVGTALKTIFARIQGLNLGDTLDDGTTLNKYSKALQSVGISIFDQAGELKNMDNILNEMADKWDTLSKAQQAALAQTVAGTRQYTQLIALMDNWDNGDNDSMTANLNTAYGSTGALQEQADIYAESWEAAQDRVTAAAEHIYSSLLNDEFFIDLLNGFEKVLETVGGLIDGLGGLKGVVGVVGSVFLASFAKQMPEALTNLRQNLMVFTGQSKKAMQEVQSELDIKLAEQQANPNLSESYKIQLEGISKVNAMKQKLVLASKNLSNQEREEYEAKIKNVQAMYEEAAALAEKKKAAEELAATTMKTASGSATKASTGIFDSYASQQDKIGTLEEKATNPNMSAEATNTYAQALETARQKAVELELQIEEVKKAYSLTVDEVDVLIGTNTDQSLLAETQKKIADKVKETTKAFTAQIKQRSNLENISTSVKSQATAWQNVAKEIKKAQAAGNTKNLSKHVDETKQKMQQYLGALQKLAQENGIKLSESMIKSMSNTINGMNVNNIEQVTQRFSNFAQVISGKANAAITTLDASIEDLRGDMSTMQFNENEIREMEQAAEGAATANQELSDSMTNISGAANENVQGTFKMSTALTEFASTAMSVSALITSMQSAISVFGDEGASGFEKFGAAISVILPLMSTFNALQALSTTLSKQDKIAKLGAAAGQMAANAMAAMGIGVKNTETGVVTANTAAWYANPIMWIALIIVGVIAALAALITVIVKVSRALSDAYNKDAIAAERAEASARALSEAYNEAKQSYEDMIAAMDEYKSARESLDSLTEGTKEYQEALEKANRAALELINNNPDLFKEGDYHWENGELIINEDAMSKAQQAASARESQAYAAMQMGQEKAKEARNVADETALRRELVKDSTTGKDYIAGALTGAFSSAAFGTILATALGGPIGLAIGGALMSSPMLGTAALGGAAMTGSIESKKLEDSGALKKTLEQLKKDSSFLDSGAENIKATLNIEDDDIINALMENKDALLELSQAQEAQAQQERLAAQQSANEILQNSQYSGMSDEMTYMGGAVFQEATDAAYDSILATMDSKGGLKAYANDYFAAQGISDKEGFKVDKYDAKNGTVSYSYLDESGQRQELEVTAEQIAMTQAVILAEQELIDSCASMSNTFDILDSNIQNANESTALLSEGMKAFLTSGDTGQLTKEQYDAMANMDADAMKEYLASIGINDSNIQDYGYNNMDAMVNDMDLTSTGDKWAEFQNITAHQGTEDLTLNQAENINNALKDIADFFGEEVGHEMLDLSAAMADSLDEAAQDDFWEQLGNISDYTDADQWDAFLEAMKESEDMTDEQIQALENYVDTAKLAARATKDLNFDEMAESVRSLRDIMKNISEGNREISDEEFAALEAQGIDTSKFAKTIDGYRYLGDSADLVADISNGITNQFKEAEQNFANIAATAQQASQNLIDAEAELAAAKEAGDRTRASAEAGAENQMSNTEKLSVIMSNIVTNVVSKIKTAWDWICGVMMDIYDFFVDIFNTIGQGITDVWNGFLQAISDIINGSIGGIMEWIEDTFDIDTGWDDIDFEKAEFTAAKTTEEIEAEENAKKAEEDLIASTQALADAIPDMVASIESSADYLSEAELETGRAEAEQNYNTAQSQYDAAVATYGEDSTQAKYYEQLVAYYEAQMDAYAKALDSKAWGEVIAEGIDTKEMESYIDLLEQAHPEMRKLYKTTEEYENALLQVATANKKMEKGVKSLSSNWDKWNDIMGNSESSAEDIATVLPEVNDAIQDVLNLDTAEFAMLPPDFAQKHWDLIQDVVNGVEGSVDTLRDMAGQEILMQIDGVVDPEGKIDQQFLDLHNKIASFDQSQFTVGVAIDPESNADFIAACNDIIQKAGMTAEQAQAYFGSMGYDVVLKPVKQQVSETVWNHVYQNIYDEKGNPAGRVIQRAWPSTFTGEVDALAIETITPNGSYGGGIGVNTTPPRTSTPSSSSSGGGGGSTPEAPDKMEKREKTNKSDVAERYREVEDAIDNVTDALTRAERATDRLWGKDKLDAMRQENKILAEQYKLLQQKAQEAEDYAKQDYNDLMDVADEIGVSVVVDTSTGDITNIEDVEETLYNRLAAAEAEYNRRVEAYNAAVEAAGDSPTEAKVKELEAMKDAIDIYEQDILTGIEDDISAWEDAEQQFQNSVETWEDAGLEAEAILDQMMQKNFDIWSESLQLEVEVNDRDLELLDYYLSKTEDNVYQMAEAAALMVGNLNSGFEGGQLGEYLDNLSIYGEKYSELTERLNSTDPEYQITSAQYKEGLEEIQSGLLDNLSSIQELDDAMLNYYGDTLSMVGEEIDKYTEKMEHQTSILEHYANMMDILGKSQDYEAMGTILEGQVETIKNELDVAEAEYDLYASEAEKKRKLYEEAIANGDAAAAELYKGEWEAAEEAAMEAQSNMLDKTEQWAEAMKAVVENKLQGLAKSLEEALTGGTSFDQINTQLEHAASLQEEYLTTTNQIYETNKLMRTAQQAMDKSTNSVAKQRLKDFIKETDQLQDKSKLSKYELEIQQAKYDLLLAEMALEDAQNAKTTVRLQRDSEGNMGYVYTADQSQLSQAQQQLEDAQNSLYNIGLEGANSYTEKYNQTMQEMYDTLTSISEAYYNGEIASQEEYEAQMLAAQEYYYEQLENFQDLYGVALQTDTRVIKDAWSTGMGAMKIETRTWKDAVSQYTGEATATLAGWYDKVDEIAAKTGLDNIANKVNNVTTESQNLKDTILGVNGDKGVIGALKDELTAVGDLTGGYANLRTTIQGLITDYENLMKTVNNAQNQQQSDQDKNENGDGGNSGDTGTDNNPDGTTPGDGDTGDTTPNTTPGNNTPSIAKGQSVTVKTSATHFSRDGGNGTRMRSFVPGSTYTVMNFDDDEVMIGRNGVVTGWVKKTDLVGFDTGGYTGSWGSYGKMAMLHEKELVLNEGDTSNFLASMEVLERILEVIDLQSMNAQLGGLLNTPSFGNNGTSQTIEQNVHIEASFPGVSDRNEIEEAFNNLINTASQYANRKF